MQHQSRTDISGARQQSFQSLIPGVGGVGAWPAGGLASVVLHRRMVLCVKPFTTYIPITHSTQYMRLCQKTDKRKALLELNLQVQGGLVKASCQIADPVAIPCSIGEIYHGTHPNRTQGAHWCNPQLPQAVRSQPERQQQKCPLQLFERTLDEVPLTSNMDL